MGPSSAIDTSDDIFDDCDENLIILTDVDEFEYDNIPTITLQNIHQCIQDLPNHDIPTNEQLDTLHHAFHQRFPIIADRAQRSGFNLLHLLIYFPGDIYEPLSTVLTKCPQVAIDTDSSGKTPIHIVINSTKSVTKWTAVDRKGKTPLHRAIESTKHNMDANSYDLLLRQSPDMVVHQAIQAGLYGDDLHEMVKAKINTLTVKDDESGLLLFMMAVESSNITGEIEEDCNITDKGEKDLMFLTVSYELLSMNPSVLQDFISH